MSWDFGGWVGWLGLDFFFLCYLVVKEIFIEYFLGVGVEVIGGGI